MRLEYCLGKRGVCVVLSGAGRDGAMATRAVLRTGGFVIAQSEESAEYAGMPVAALELGRVDLVLPLSEIAFALTRLVQNEQEPALSR
jgi:two-component system chemotaxis response regulator CheB